MVESYIVKWNFVSMGATLAKLGRLATKEPKKVVLLGLDSAGKTTILYKLNNSKEVITTIPTIGFNVESGVIDGMEVNCWDVGGRSPIRPLYRYYYQGTDGIVFVIDSSDRDRLSHVEDELRRVVAEDTLIGVPLLILANKSDLPNALNVDKLEKMLNISALVGSTRSYRLQPVSAMSTPHKLHEAVRWLKEQIESKDKQSRDPVPAIAVNADSKKEESVAEALMIAVPASA